MILRLMEYAAVPIINENDTVSTEELQTTFGDNDRLAAMVTNLISRAAWSCSQTSRASMTVTHATLLPKSLPLCPA